MGGLEDTRAQISRELRYQSSLDLDEATYAAIRHLPLAQDLVRASRQQLVHRLDTYSKRHHKIFMEVSSPYFALGIQELAALPCHACCEVVQMSMSFHMCHDGEGCFWLVMAATLVIMLCLMLT